MFAQPTRRWAPKYSCLLKGLEISGPEQVWCSDITYVSMASGFMHHVSSCDNGLAESVCSGLGSLEHTGQRLFYPSVAEGAGDGLAALDIEHGSRMPIHERGLYGSSSVTWGRRGHGRSWRMDRQPIHQADWMRSRVVKKVCRI